MMLVGAIGFRCVVDDLDSEERLLARKRAPPQRAKDLVLIKPNATRVAQIGSHTVRLFASTVAIDHDPPQIRARHALNRLDRDALWLFDQCLPDLCAMPMPPGPTRAAGDRGANFAMQLPCFVAVNVTWPLRRDADHVQDQEETAAFDELNKAAIERDAEDLVRVIELTGMGEPKGCAEIGLRSRMETLFETPDDLLEHAPQHAIKA